jgi:hypothetical protein
MEGANLIRLLHVTTLHAAHAHPAERLRVQQKWCAW